MDDRLAPGPGPMRRLDVTGPTSVEPGWSQGRPSRSPAGGVWADDDPPHSGSTLKRACRDRLSGLPEASQGTSDSSARISMRVGTLYDTLGPGPGPDGLGIEVGPGGGHDDRRDLLFHLGVGKPEHQGVGDVTEALEHQLDLGVGDTLAPRDFTIS